jgi:EAL domain-containing protein (putative c-di-GMP-specific phosphodiesterase class I)
MKVPTRPDSVVATNRAAARRQLAFSTITNFSELKAAFSEAVVPAIERHIKNRLMSVKRGAATIVFLDGPFLLIDLSTRLTAGIRNEDALCELLNALLMEEPVSYESQHLLLNVETTLIEWTDMDRQLVQRGEVSKLMSRMLDTLKLNREDKQFRALRADMELAAFLFGQLAAGNLALTFQPVGPANGPDTVLYWKSFLRRRPDTLTKDYSCCSHYVNAAERVQLASRLDRSLIWTHIDLLKQHPDISLGCSISVQSLNFNCWWRMLFAELSDHPDVAKRLVIEITETTPLATNDEALLLLRTLRLLGCKLAIDNVGVGQSTISFAVHTLPDFIKVDRSDASRIEATTTRSERVAAYLIELCTDLGSSVIVQAASTPPTATPAWLNEPAVVKDAFAPTHDSYRATPLIPAMQSPLFAPHR